MSYLRADVLLSFFHTEIRSRAQYARRIFPQRKRRLRASYLLGRYPVALFPFLFISAGLRRKGEKLFFKTPPSASYVSSKRSPRFHPRAADTSQFFGQSLCLFIRLSILNSLSWRKLVSFAHAQFPAGIRIMRLLAVHISYYSTRSFKESQSRSFSDLFLSSLHAP